MVCISVINLSSFGLGEEFALNANVHSCMDTLKVTRKVLPVGQGMSTLESFQCYCAEDGGKSKSIKVMFDCGGNAISKVIGQNKEELKTIDFLFLSHLDSDHINGLRILKACNVRTIVMPFYNDKQNFLLGLCSNADDRKFFRNSDAWLKERFGDSLQIIKVRPVGSNNNGANNGNAEDIEKPGLTDIPSGNMLKWNTIWTFIPYHRPSCFDNDVDIRNILSCYDNSDTMVQDLSDLRRLPKDIKDILKRKGQKERIKSVVNALSMIVFSGPYNISGTYSWNSLQPEGAHCSCDKVITNISCLYCGDAFTDDVYDFSKLLGDKRLSLGLIQIPHHGSVNSYNEKLYCVNPFCHHYFVNYGFTNLYGHPDASILEEMSRRGIHVHHVTEDPTSQLLQYLTILIS